MSFKDCNIEPVYRSGPDNILNDFYKPLFKHAIKYDRAVGFFSAEVLEANLKGIISLVKNGGAIRLVIGHPISDDEFSAIKCFEDYDGVLNELNDRFDAVMLGSDPAKFNKLEILAWLSMNGRLQVKFALRRHGMYHEKIGILQDDESNTVCFLGSANETIYALTGGYNAESIMVFPSWMDAFDTYGTSCINGFEAVWNNELENTITLDMPSEFYEKLNTKAIHSDNVEQFIETHSKEVYDEYISMNYGSKIPQLPPKLGGHDFILKEHQKNSIKLWWQNEHKGILKLATGSGKTITSIAAFIKVYESRAREGGKTALIVSVPYQELARQWVVNLEQFNIRAIKCWDSQGKWLKTFEKALIKFSLGTPDFLAIVVVNRTMEGEVFKKLISQLDPNDIMLIGDECHNHGSSKTNASLPDAYFRMGLSATPFRSDKDEIDSPFPDIAKERILSYYKGIVATYSLGDAINDGVLCEYDYHIVAVYLSESEQDKYEEISADIGKLIAAGATTAKSNNLTLLCGQRSRLLGGAENKLPALASLLEKLKGGNKKGTLFYCGEGKSVNYSVDSSEDEDEKIVKQVSSLLYRFHWNSARFTSDETTIERAQIMKDFKSGQIDALVSMKVLDEGVDVPYCDKAFILASTRNPRQYIQRRGRVLRKAEGKEKSTIYDFIILPSSTASAKSAQALKAAELARIDDYCLLAINRLDVERSIKKLGLRKEL